MIRIEHIHFTYGNSDSGVPEDASLSARKGECILLRGSSGRGKATITRLVNGLIPHFYEGEGRGTISVCGII